MGFKCGIVGLPNVGKSTLFNALTESNNAEAANYPFATIESNIGRVPVLDSRLKELSKINNSEKTIPTFIDFVDIAGLVKGASKGEGLGNKFLANIREMDAIAHVVRCFEDENITHVSDTINPIYDIEIIKTELQLSDIQTLENRYTKLEKKTKSNDKDSKEELLFINDLMNKLNNSESINSISFSEKQKTVIKDLNLITNKPTLYVCNVDEKSILKGNIFSQKVKEKINNDQDSIVIVSAVLESQIAQFKNEKEKLEILYDMNLKQTTLKKLIDSGYDLLNLITFFTSGPKETRAWTVKKNTKAPDAAGKIHTDFKKGFIRAETISYEDFIQFNGENGCREVGKMRQEGKDYIVKDGDIFNFLFNI